MGNYSKEKIDKAEQLTNRLRAFALMSYQRQYIQKRLEQIPTTNLIDILANAGVNIIDAYQTAKSTIPVHRNEDMDKAMYKIADSLEHIELLPIDDISSSLSNIWNKTDKTNRAASKVRSNFRKAILQEWYGEDSIPKNGNVWTKKREINGVKTSILDAIINLQTSEKTETYMLKSDKDIKNVLSSVQKSLQSSLNNMNGPLGEQKAYYLVTQVLKDAGIKNKNLSNISGSVTGQDRGYINEQVAVQAKPDVIITYTDNSDSNNSAKRKIVISAKQYKSLTMTLAKTQTALSLLYGTSEFYLNEYFALQGHETPINTYVSSYMYFILGMNGLIGNLTHYAQKANQQGQQFMASANKIPSVNNFVGFCQKSMYVLSAKDFLQEFFQQIPLSTATNIKNLNKYKQVLVVHGNGLSAFLTIGDTLPNPMKDKNAFYNIKLNVHLNMQKANTSKLKLQEPLFKVIDYISSS